MPTEVKAADRGEPIELTGTDLDGNAVDLADLRGKPVVVNVWWSECPPCRVEEPDLNAAAAELGDSVATLWFNFIGINFFSTTSQHSYAGGADRSVVVGPRLVGPPGPVQAAQEVGVVVGAERPGA